MLVIRRLFGTGTNCIAPSGLPLLLCLFPGLAPWAFLSRPCGASFAPETRLDSHCAIWSAAACCRFRACGNVPSSLKRKQACALREKPQKETWLFASSCLRGGLGAALTTRTRRRAESNQRGLSFTVKMTCLSSERPAVCNRREVSRC